MQKYYNINKEENNKIYSKKSVSTENNKNIDNPIIKKKNSVQQVKKKETK
jgi:hypothetical protein